jgi:glucan-binding YG repeat protein
MSNIDIDNTVALEDEGNMVLYAWVYENDNWCYRKLTQGEVENLVMEWGNAHRGVEV